MTTGGSLSGTSARGTADGVRMSPVRQQRLRSVLVRRVVAASMFFVIIVSVGVWLVTRQTLPEIIRIAAAEEGGLYCRVARLLAPHLEQRTGSRVQVLVTRGSVHNRELLLAGEAELAILQHGAVGLAELGALAPLYRDLVHVVVRADGGIDGVRDLAGKRVIVGRPGSGMRESAMAVLQHYGLTAPSVEPRESYFLGIESDSEVDACIVTTGLLNPDLDRLLAGGDYRLLGIQDAEALSVRHGFFTVERIPRGFFRERPPVPDEGLPTVATTTFLAARADAAPVLVRATLQALYEGGLRDQVPTLVGINEAAAWSAVPQHPSARSYFQPYSGLGILANFMESLAALKELLFAFGAGLYLVWTAWRRMKDRERAAVLQQEKERMDVFLKETVRIEREAMGGVSAERLGALLAEVTEIRLTALEELTHEELRGDLAFAIFLRQCNNLSARLEARLQRGSTLSPLRNRPPGQA